MLTTHLVVKGEITLQEEGKERKTFKVGDRADVGANVRHEAWIGPQVFPLGSVPFKANLLQGCTYVIAEQ